METVTDKHIKLFARRLRELRNEKGYSQKELAKIIGCAPGLISYYETCKREPGFTNILKLCQEFDESPDYLLGVTNYRSIKKIAK